MAPPFRFLQIHAALTPQLTESELQEALQNVTTQVNGAFKPFVVVKASSILPSRILPSLIGSLSETLGRNANLTTTRSLDGSDSPND